MLYGLTVGHIIEEEHAGDDKLDGYSFSGKDVSEIGNESEEEEVFLYGGDEDFVIDLAGEEVCGTEEQTSGSWSTMGHLSTSSHDDQGDQPNLDWALIEFDDPLLYRPNLLPISHTNLIEANRGPNVLHPCTAEVRIVIPINGRCSKFGTLSNSPSFLLLAPGKKLIDAYSVAMDKGSGKC